MMYFQQACETMINQQLRTNSISAPLILEAIRTTPRENFVPDNYREFAYADFAIPLAHQQTMWLPQLEAQVLQALNIRPSDHILEVGTGTGYFTALLTQFGEAITSVDIFKDFVEQAAVHPWFKQYHHINWICADYANGPLSETERYDVIIITGTLKNLPQAYLDALQVNGRLIALIGSSPIVDVILFTKTTQGITYNRLTETNVPALLQLQAGKGNFQF